MAPERKCNLANRDANEIVTKQHGFVTFLPVICKVLLGEREPQSVIFLSYSWN